MPPLSKPLTRKQLSEFLPNERAIRAFEDLQSDILNGDDVLTSAAFVMVDPDANFPASRTLEGSPDITVTDGGAGGNVEIELSGTGVTPDIYGDATKLVVLGIDAKGRVISASEVALNSDNVAEGATNLYFTNVRARNAFSGAGQIDVDNSTGVISATGDTAALIGGPITQIVTIDGIVTLVANEPGFTGSGTFTNFDIVDGVVTNAT